MQKCASVSDPAAAGKQIGAGDDTLSTAPQRIPLADAAIDIWLTRLDLDAEQVGQCALHLSQDELLRANRFHFDRDRRRFIVARATLRALLGGCLAVKPSAIALGYARNGKPILADHAAGIHFNVSHAHERALYAISKSCALGVDIEYLNREVDYSGLAERFFTRRECAALQRIPEPERKRAFLACWTRKEAVIKATGDGLSLALDQFDVTVAPEAAPCVLDSATALLGGYWNLYGPDVGHNYIAAVAAHYRG